jgi:alpha-tubulin suppressor-like RCC1 family protein
MGRNNYGQLGDGNTTDRHSPVQILASGVTQIAAGSTAGNHSLFLKSDGSLHAMGHNVFGQLGDGTTTNRNSPVQILASGVTQIAAGRYHSLFLKSDGSLHAMGDGGYGQLGDGTETDRNSPVQILASGVTQIAAGRYHSLFLKSDGSLHATGDNEYGQLGDGNSGEDVYKDAPVKVIDLISTVEQAYVAETAADVIDPLK